MRGVIWIKTPRFSFPLRKWVESSPHSPSLSPCMNKLLWGAGSEMNFMGLNHKLGKRRSFFTQPRWCYWFHVLGCVQSILWTCIKPTDVILRKHTNSASFLARLQINQWKVLYLVTIIRLHYQFSFLVIKKKKKENKGSL